MKRTIICILAALCLAAAAGCANLVPGSAAGAQAPQEPATEAAQKEQTTQAAQADLTALTAATQAASGTQSADEAQITEAAAKEIALTHAELAEADVTFLKVKLEKDDGRTVYDIEFYVDNAEYDYEIDANTGEILSYDYDIESYVPAATQSTTPATSNDSAQITEAAAKEFALAHAELAEADVTFLKAKLEKDDGRTVYDIEFYAGNAEYDYEIDATTGEIHAYDYDIESNNAPSASGDSSIKISVDEAKAIALKKAGLSASAVTFTKAKLDYEDGCTVYEIEFVSGAKEYEVEINAETGDITEYDAEYDD